MRCGTISIDELNEYVLECDRLAGVDGVGPVHPNCMEYQSNFSLDVDIKFGKTLDPFSEQYRSSMPPVSA